MEINTLVKKEKINAFNGLHIEEVLFSKRTSGCIKLEDEYPLISVKEYVHKKVHCEDARLLSSFKMVFLDEGALEKKVSALSTSEVLRLELAIAFIQNVDTFVLYQFDFYFMEKDCFYFKKLFKKLVTKYHKTILLLDSRLDFMMDLVDRIVVRNEKNELEVFAKPTFYEERLLTLLGRPNIVSFVLYAQSKGKKLGNYTDIKELIKAIYREV